MVRLPSRSFLRVGDSEMVDDGLSCFDMVCFGVEVFYIYFFLHGFLLISIDSSNEGVFHKEIVRQEQGWYKQFVFSQSFRTHP